MNHNSQSTLQFRIYNRLVYGLCTSTLAKKRLIFMKVILELWWKRIDSRSVELDMVCGGVNFFNFAEFQWSDIIIWCFVRFDFGWCPVHSFYRELR